MMVGAREAWHFHQMHAAEDIAGQVSFNDLKIHVNKSLVRQRLSWIVISQPEVSPSRATIQAAKAFLMSDEHLPTS